MVYRGIHIKSLDAPCVVKYDAPKKGIPVRVFVRLRLARGCAVAAEYLSMVGWLLAKSVTNEKQMMM